MHIVYISTCQSKDSFKEYQKLFSKPINSSNQNFHNKLIHALAMDKKVTAISIRSITNNCAADNFDYKEEKEDNIIWKYLKVTKRNFVLETLSINKQLKNISKSLPEDSIILTDTINPMCAHYAKKIQAYTGFNIVGIVTDSPNYISGVNELYKKAVFSFSSGLNGYICLTKELNKQFNTYNDPNLILEGIVSNEENETENKYGRYIFFSGAMLEKYGVYNLIEAFKQIEDKDLKLILCGHHYNKDKLQDAIKDNPNIIFLGTLLEKEVKELQANSLASINPRPLNPSFDNCSIPSKVLEYLSSGSLVISTPNKILNNIFNDGEIIFLKDDSTTSIKDSIDELIKLNDKDIESKKIKNKEKVQELYGFSAVNKKITDFLSKIISD